MNLSMFYVLDIEMIKKITSILFFASCSFAYPGQDLTVTAPLTINGGVISMVPIISSVTISSNAVIANATFYHNAAPLFPIAPLITGQAVCLANGANCPAGGGGQTIVKSSSVLTVTGTTLLNIPNLETTLLANTTYQYNFYILYQTTVTTTGARFAMEFPGTPITLAYTTEIMFAADGAGGAFQCSGTTDNDACIGTAVVAASTSYLTHIKGVVTTGASGGVMVPQIACELASPAQATARPGSVGIIVTVP